MKANDLGISPAPWKYDDNSEGNEGMLGVYDANGDTIAFFGEMESCDWKDIAEANLFAAAPDLYEALREMVEDYTAYVKDLPTWLGKARAAIKKARA